VLVAQKNERPTANLNGMTQFADLTMVQRPAATTERAPGRAVPAKGGGAHGFFEVTEDVSELTKADFLQPGRRTPVYARFSSVAGALGSADTVRDPRGFAVRFGTRQGNYDLAGNSTPVFFIRDPRKVLDFIRSRNRQGDTSGNDMRWDFWTSTPESAHQVTILMTDRGIPWAWANMNGYAGRTYLWENPSGVKFWVKYHWKTEQGVVTFTDAEARAMVAEDPDFHLRGLRASIARGEDPVWRLETQVMPFEAAADYRVNPFDLTKVWPHADFPPVTVGRMVLNRNPENRVAPATLEPASTAPAIGPGWQVGEIVRAAHAKHRADDPFAQPGALYRDVLTEPDRVHLVTNIANHLRDGVQPDVLTRALAFWSDVDAQLGARVAKAMTDGGRRRPLSLRTTLR
jgi:catalase